MQQLIHDLLDYSRVGNSTQPFEPVETSVVVEKVLESLHEAIRESDAVISTGELPAVSGDESQLRQVFQNLIQNAIKFRGERVPRIHIEGSRVGSEYRLSVADNGIGIEPRFADQVFQMFQRLHARTDYEGNGIGLALTKKVIERHGGRIWFESEPNIGTTFYLTLPAIQENAQ